jgi:putative endonuclease
MHYIYIIYSEMKDRYYVGQCENIPKRIAEHIIRKNLGGTDWILKYSEEYETRGLAMKREYEIKKKKSRKYVEWLISSAG